MNNAFRQIFIVFFAGLGFWLPVAARAQSLSNALIKQACPAGSSADHPCRAVYYSGGDGKRHAFPNEKTFFTWYADFSGVKTVSAAALAALPLGQNVTYRPGARLVKFVTVPKVYAVALGGTLRWVSSESAAATLYGADWNTKIDDIADTFFTDYRIGADIAGAADFTPSAERAFAVTIDDNLPSSRRSLTVTTGVGSFSVELIKLQQDRFGMLTDTAAGQDCADNCPVKALSEYVQTASADIAIHGSYFCPTEYPSCAGKTNSFLWPFYDSDGQTMVNQSSLAVHEGPMLTYGTDHQYHFFHRTKDLGTAATALIAAASNYPSLVESGSVVVLQESRLDQDMRNVKAVRGGIGIDARFVYLVVARNATVPDLAEIMRTLGAQNAMNLDGGGSAALWYSGAYAFGPGRSLPNAILFRAR